MSDSARDLPRVINTAMSVAVSGFVLMNVALFTVLTFQNLRDRSTVAVVSLLHYFTGIALPALANISTKDFGLQVFGSIGGLVYSLVVSMSCLGSLNASVFASGRLMVAASKDHYFPKILGNGHCPTKEDDSASTRQMLRGFPTPIASSIIWIAARTEHLRWDKMVPMYVPYSSHSRLSLEPG